MDTNQNITSRYQRVADRVADDLARLRILLLDAEDALVAALQHLQDSRQPVSDNVLQDLHAIRSIRAGLDSAELPPTPAPVESRQRRPVLEGLTARERDVAVWLARGLTNRQIGDKLVISPATVRVHVEHIFVKLGLHTRAQLAAWVAGQATLSDQ